MRADNPIPREIADKQLVAYNAHNLDDFCHLFADDAQLIELPSMNTFAQGIGEIRAFYQERFSHPELHCEVHLTMDIGRFAIDRETVYGLPGDNIEAVAIYEVVDHKIVKVFFIRD
ncbi:steroid delta-isomerase [Aliikangiella marina]|uniref:Steroid delta-isomerase n=1 Tax=Aliikangiella marina TaxID=1712262 RepID=A0A545THY0_9GAMM|nr:nuclear transport factor 2 family protein [Aliikangiella marina]TQV76840.1 steroid delta-isomerase [Aliikangiella marina]